MEPGTHTFKGHKHVCIFVLERKNGSFTGDVICTVCGVKPSSANQTSVKEKAIPDNPRNL
jgi:hypothetical protein